jgi:hypothetical protein
MSKKVSITLDDEILIFVDQFTTNRSSFINELLIKERNNLLLKELAEAYQEQSNDPEFQAEMAVWDSVVGDGLHG